MSEAALLDACRRLKLDPIQAKIHKLLKLKDFFEFYARSMNLGGREGIDDHLIEGLQVVALAQRLGLAGRWLDVGSGGGFPGLVLAAWLENFELVLVEPRAKRASFLELGLAKLGRGDVKVLRGRIDRGQWKGVDRATRLDAHFDVASARAVFPPEQWLEEARPWVVEGGVICLHLSAGEPAPEGHVVAGRVDGSRWAAVGIRKCST